MQSVDSVALLPAYLAAGTAVLVLLADLLVARPRGRRSRWPALGAAGHRRRRGAGRRGTASGARSASAPTAPGSRRPGGAGRAWCSPLLTLGVLGLSGPLLRAGRSPVGEYCFLLACSMTGGVVLGAAGDLITLIVALETLTLPLYVLVGLRRGSLAERRGGGDVLRGQRGGHRGDPARRGAALRGHRRAAPGPARRAARRAAELLDLPLTTVAVALVLVGLAFKVAAVPFHAWAPATYDGAPLPVAAYLSTASKLGGVVALLAVVQRALPGWT